MSYLDRIAACNNADLSVFLPFIVGGEILGWIHRDRAASLTDRFDSFAQDESGIVLDPALDTPQTRSAALAGVAAALAGAGHVRRLTGELYAARNRWLDAPRFLLDRAAVSYFGLRSYGVHLNAYVQRPDGLHLWIATRAKDKPTYPGQLDNTVAGGQPHDLTLFRNLEKECAEEASITPAMTADAVPVESITYIRQEDGRLKPDCMYCYDLELPHDFTPANSDGEIDRFDLLPVDAVMARVRDTADFKFNSAIALIGFFIRHGMLDPDMEPDYVALADGLRTPAPNGMRIAGARES